MARLNTSRRCHVPVGVDQTLTTELQGLTAIVHIRRMLDVPLAEDVEEPEKPGMLARWLGGRRKRHVRIGHA